MDAARLPLNDPIEAEMGLLVRLDTDAENDDGAAAMVLDVRFAVDPEKALGAAEICLPTDTTRAAEKLPMLAVKPWVKGPAVTDAGTTKYPRLTYGTGTWSDCVAPLTEPENPFPE